MIAGDYHGNEHIIPEEEVFIMQNEFEAGALVQHRDRPGVWRVMGIAKIHAAIEPWDDTAAASFHASEAYDIVAPIQELSRLIPGRSATALTDCEAACF